MADEMWGAASPHDNENAKALQQFFDHRCTDNDGEYYSLDFVARLFSDGVLNIFISHDREED